MTMLRNCMDRMSPAGKTVLPFLNRSHNNSWQVLVGHCVLCVLRSHRISGFYVSDHKAWADKINRRFQSCRTDYNKIATRGKFGKSGQGKYKNLTALQKWKCERYSFLAPFYKQGQKPLGQSKTSVVLGGLPPSTDNESDEGPDDGNDSSSSNTRKEGRELFIRPWHLHLPFGKAWSEPDPRMRRYPQTRSHAITESLWQWWRNLQATLYAVPLTDVIRSGTVSLRGWMISLANCPDTVGEHSKWRLWRWRWK